MWESSISFQNYLSHTLWRCVKSKIYSSQFCTVSLITGMCVKNIPSWNVNETVENIMFISSPIPSNLPLYDYLIDLSCHVYPSNRICWIVPCLYRMANYLFPCHVHSYAILVKKSRHSRFPRSNIYATKNESSHIIKICASQLDDHAINKVRLPSDNNVSRPE